MSDCIPHRLAVRPSEASHIHLSDLQGFRTRPYILTYIATKIGANRGIKRRYLNRATSMIAHIQIFLCSSGVMMSLLSICPFGSSLICRKSSSRFMA